MQKKKAVIYKMKEESWKNNIEIFSKYQELSGGKQSYWPKLNGIFK